LKAEREQGITIDVAYRYFATARRKFILADTPGHEQYTRNMATGASTAEVAILLVDARHGVREQTERHSRIARLLGITHFVLAVNKMDLMDFDRRVFESICEDFTRLVPAEATHAIPLSALDGDNVIGPSARTPWFEGQALLPYLETVEVERERASGAFRMPVQLVSRPDHSFRGYAGQIVSGRVALGDPLTIFPSGVTASVKRIVTFDGDLDEAFAPMSVTLVLDREVDVSRGDVLAGGPVQVANRIEADIVWMDERPLNPSRMYLIKHNARTVAAEVDRGLTLNEIGKAVITTTRPLLFDPYGQNRETGSFILIDSATNFTAGAGMIIGAAREMPRHGARPAAAERIAAAARTARNEADAVEAVRRVLEEVLV
jgi:sulfate adenylyltransferase large subunit